MSHIAKLFFHLYLVFTMGNSYEKCIQCTAYMLGKANVLDCLLISFLEEIGSPQPFILGKILALLIRWKHFTQWKDVLAYYHRGECEASGPFEITPITINMLPLCGVLWEQIQWTWCKMCFFIFGCLHVLIKFISGFTDWEECGW